MAEYVIEMLNITKVFPGITANDNITLQLRPGEIHALLGENGAGKSTTISILCGQLAKDSGQVKICGLEPEENIEAITRELGVVFQSSVLDGVLTVRDNLQSRAALYGITGRAFRKRLDELGELLGFQELLGRTVNRLSGGQRRRIDIARALLHRPRILILDEPTTGLHFADVHKLIEILRRLSDGGNTVVVIEHNLDVIKTADYIIDIGPEGGDKGGTVIAKGTPEEVAESPVSYTGKYVKRYLGH